MEKSDEIRKKLYFADAVLEALEPEKSLPAKFKRMLKKFELEKRVKDKVVAVKMHLGGYIGYTTIHPVFVKILVDELKEAKAKSIKVMDGNAGDGVARGYTREILGCPVVSSFGESWKYVYKEKIGFKTLEEVNFSGEAVDSDFFIDLAHAKGHGACGFGGAIKNIAMGLVDEKSRGALHGLEGGIIFDKKKCKLCLKCVDVCTHKAVRYEKEKKELWIFYHDCTGCQHCVLTCPEHAMTLDRDRFGDFSRGMAIVTQKFLSKFKPENLLFITFLTNITIYCDCWGFSSPSLVPDIGILAGEDIAAIETATLDMIKVENLLKTGLPKGRKLYEEGKHLFEKIHGKDPYIMIRELEKIYPCSSKYEIEEVK